MSSKTSQKGKKTSGFGFDDEEEDDNKYTPVGVESNKRNDDSEKNNKSNIFIFNLNELICITNIFATALGLGVLTFPYILYEIGVINSLFIFIFVSISIYYSLDLLRRFVVDSSLFSYSIITQATLGNRWLIIYAIATILFFSSGLVNYLKIVYNIFNSMIIIENILPKIFYLIISLLIQIILCKLTVNVSKIFVFSIIIFSASIIIICIVIVKGIINLSKGKDNYFSVFSIRDSNLNSWDIFLLINSKFIEFFYGYIYHNTFPTLLSDLTNLDNKNTKRIHNTSYSIIFIYYSIFSFFGLFCIGDYDEKSNPLILIENELPDTFAFFVKIIFFLYFISLIPIRYIVIRDNYTSIIGKENISVTMEIIITSAFLLIINIIVVFVILYDHLISDIIILFGAFFGVFICFVLPVLNYVAINGKTKGKSIIGYMITVIFIIIGFFSIFHNVKKKL